MIYPLSSIIKENNKPMWQEGSPYIRKALFEINKNGPPVNYSSYTLKPHSLPHIESPAHTQQNGITIDLVFKEKKWEHFCGKTTLVKIKGNNFKETGFKERLWEISREEIQKALEHKKQIPKRLLITLEDMPLDKHGQHDPSYALILSKEAAEYLTANDLKLYGTSWKSSDYARGSHDRPIHNTLFKTALIMECLDLNNIPEGDYFLSAFPLPLEASSEAALCPVLFSYDFICKDLINSSFA